jgi:pyruvate/2-oxoglutarate dehydrogenase complex dihydrolipoamide acyltransferase (E2) component
MWRPLIESAKRDLYDAAYSSSASLAEEMLAPYPGAVSPVCVLMNKHLESSIESMQSKVEEVFKQESDPFISKNELSDAILKVRFERFEKAMEAVMSQCGSGPAEAQTATATEAQQAQRPSEEDKLSATAAAQQTAAAAAQSEEAEENEDAFVSPDLDQPEHPLKELVSASLGRWYMANHGVTSMSMVEDMRTVRLGHAASSVCTSLAT